MSTLQRGRMFQDYEFVFTEFDGLRLERLVVCENRETRNCVLAYIKVENHNWQQFFLDAGIGFWEEWDDIELDDDPTFQHWDKAVEFGLIGKRIQRIHCEPDQLNSRIIIAFEHGLSVILRTVEPTIFDGISELVLSQA